MFAVIDGYSLETGSGTERDGRKADLWGCAWGGDLLDVAADRVEYTMCLLRPNPAWERLGGQGRAQLESTQWVARAGVMRLSLEAGGPRTTTNTGLD